ncbi:MAG: UbiD family decarboxylase [Alphaproteobacteria bacterium]|nr:UbiD family decarboxylase [Alphaproteobacteria bacterium]
MAAKKVATRGYRDLHEHIEALREADLLVEVTRPINKDTEMHPLVRWQYRGGIPEKDRKAFLFTNVIDSKGRKFDIPVLICGLGGNPAIYEIGIRHPLDQIKDLWSQALNNPLEPAIIDSADAPCHEQVFEGADLMNGHGLDDIPVPISTPGWDNAPYTSSSHFITKDPDNGIQNVGNYRGQVKAPDRIGINTSVELRTGGYIHWLKWKARGEPMPCAVVVGCPPIVSYGSVQKMPEDQDEMAVTGALAGSPIRMVAAKTVDLLVPADAEVIIEGFVDTEYLEPEAPFGESHGYINLCEYNGFLDITAITRRKDAVITSWMSQVAPSESSVIRRFAFEAAQTRYLRDSLGIQGLIAVKAHENLTSLQRLVAIVFERSAPRTEIWRAMYGIAAFRQAEGKWIVAVNDDIDPGNGDALFWAMCYRTRPQRDVEILKNQHEGHGPRSQVESADAAVLIDATLKETYPPVAMPKREYMEKAAEIWDELGLPALTPEKPWYGYDLGEWNEEFEIMAQRAVKSDYWETGKIFAQRRRKDVEMNTEIRSLKDEDED